MDATLAPPPDCMERKFAETGQLAIDGGPPLRVSSLPSWPSFDHEQIFAATAVLQSGKVNYWTGDEGRCFEREMAALTDTKYAVATANGTLALELALHAIGAGPGDEVIVPCRTFIASASSVALQGATPVFADVDPDSGNITAGSIEAALTPRTKAVVVVHLAGWPCDMDSIMELAQDRGLKVVEDCAQALGATYKGRPIGSLGDVAAFSFCQDKIITAGGEGGMVVTDDRQAWKRAWSYKDHGKSWDAVYDREHPTVFRWVHESLGTNGRLTEMQAAIGRVALRRLSGWVDVRREHATMLDEALAKFESLRVVVPPSEVKHSYYKYYVYLRPERLRSGWNRDRILRAIEAEGVPCGCGICPEVYLEGAFQRGSLAPSARRPVARQLGETSLLLRVDPALSIADIQDTVRAFDKVLRVATTSNQKLNTAAA